MCFGNCLEDSHDLDVAGSSKIPSGTGTRLEQDETAGGEVTAFVTANGQQDAVGRGYPLVRYATLTELPVNIQTDMTSEPDARFELIGSMTPNAMQ